MAVTKETVGDGIDPPYYYPGYASTVYRAPRRPLVTIPESASELTEPVYGHEPVGETDNDLTRQHAGEPQGQRIFVSGRVLDSDGRPVPNTLVEIWQANAAGRYPDPEARKRLISSFDLDTTQPEWALSFKWDVVLRGRRSTPMEG